MAKPLRKARDHALRRHPRRASRAVRSRGRSSEKSAVVAMGHSACSILVRMEC